MRTVWWTAFPEDQNMKNKTRKPKKCQWIEGVMSLNMSAWHPCHEKPMFEVLTNGETVGHVCSKHSIPMTQRGYQIR